MDCGKTVDITDNKIASTFLSVILIAYGSSAARETERERKGERGIGRERAREKETE